VPQQNLIARYSLPVGLRLLRIGGPADAGADDSAAGVTADEDDVSSSGWPVAFALACLLRDRRCSGISVT